MYLTIPDYAVTVVMLLVPLAIGVFYAWKDSKNVNREVYLLGGRQMSMLPVSLSLFVTYQSAISLIGIPSDVYLHGAMIFHLHVGMAIANIVGCYTMIPLMYPLQLTSIFDYLEMRFDSKAVRLLSTAIGMLQTFCYMVIALLAPGLAVQAAAGIPFWISVVIVGSIGTVYTAIGGIKSVIWTDAFQTVVVFVGVFILLVKGSSDVGGVEKVWSIAEAGGRSDFGDINPDPRTRHTIWGGSVGMTFVWLANVFNQATLQRLSSMKSIPSARKAYLLNAPSNVLYGFLLTAVGITVYSYFYMVRCDPIEAGMVSNPNQIILVYVLHSLRKYPGLAGLYMATIFSGALSTLSSGINALAANTVEDILGVYLRRFSEKKITVLAKVFVFFYGFVIIGVTYLGKSLQGPVTQMGGTIFGICGSAVLAIFIIACTVPWANKYGALAGGIISLVINAWIVIGNRMYGKKAKVLPSLPIDGCNAMFNDSWTSSASLWTPVSNQTTPIMATATMPLTEDDSSDYGFFLYEVSYVWYGLIGTFICSSTILLVSLLTGGRRNTKTDPKLILPMLRNFWQLDDIAKNDESLMESLNKAS